METLLYRLFFVGISYSKRIPGQEIMDLEANNHNTEKNLNRGKNVAKTGKKAHSWYSRMTKMQKIIMWLLAVLAVLAIALGVGLGVGLNQHHGQNNDNDSD